MQLKGARSEIQSPLVFLNHGKTDDGERRKHALWVDRKVNPASRETPSDREVVANVDGHDEVRLAIPPIGRLLRQVPQAVGPVKDVQRKYG